MELRDQRGFADKLSTGGKDRRLQVRPGPYLRFRLPDRIFLLTDGTLRPNKFLVKRFCRGVFVFTWASPLELFGEVPGFEGVWANAKTLEALPRRAGGSSGGMDTLARIKEHGFADRCWLGKRIGWLFEFLISDDGSQLGFEITLQLPDELLISHLEDRSLLS